MAGKVQQDGKLVSTEDIAAVRQEGATDREIHDTVLIAAVFSMCNRYVDGLGTWKMAEQSNSGRPKRERYIPKPGTLKCART